MTDNRDGSWEHVDRRKNTAVNIERLLDKLDDHFKEEASYRREFGERFVSIESDLSSVSQSMKKLADVLERLTLIEERDRSHNKALDEINVSIKELKKDGSDNKEIINTKIVKVDSKINKWMASAGGVSLTLVVLWAILGNYTMNKIADMDRVKEEFAIHLRTDSPTGWPPTTPGSNNNK